MCFSENLKLKFRLAVPNDRVTDYSLPQQQYKLVED
jgi:hypothetical protein